MADRLTEAQLNDIVIIERVCSSLSLIGCAFIIVTFLSSRAFHKPINRLVFYASFGNMMTNVATLMGRTALSDVNGALCQLQGFLIQMFMCADSIWTLAMACNVYLTFFYHYDAVKIRALEKWYFLASYGLPFVPALVYLFVKNHEGARMYGDATLWCWISRDFDVIRIATFYGPVWVAILATFIIYIRAGKEIYQKRKQLISFERRQGASHTLVSFSEFAPVVQTEVRVHRSKLDPNEQPLDLSRLGRRPSETPSKNPQMYSVTVSSSPEGGLLSPPPTLTRFSTKSADSPITPVAEARQQSRPNVEMRANNAAWSYTKVAILFFTAMLVTWIPSSANRVYSVMNQGSISPPLQFASAFVLPLQGFWNALIYMTTSWKACRTFFTSNPFGGVKSVPCAFKLQVPRRGQGDGFRDRLPSRGKDDESDSTTDLHSPIR